MRPVRSSISLSVLERKGVSKIFFDKTIEDFQTYGNEEHEQIKKYFSKYISNFQDELECCHGIYLCGSNGTGKTMLTSLLVKEAYRQRYTSRRVLFSDYITEHTRVWGVKSNTEREELEGIFYNTYKAVEFLVLDEVGKEVVGQDTAAGILEDCLRYREDKMLPSIICTNMNIKDFATRYGKSVNSLVARNCSILRLSGEDNGKEFFRMRKGV